MSLCNCLIYKALRLVAYELRAIVAMNKGMGRGHDVGLRHNGI